MIQVLKELSQVISKNKLRHINHESSFLKGELVYDLYSALLNKQHFSEEEIKQLLLTKSYSEQQYRISKSKLYKQLINCLFLIDTTHASYSDRERAYQECHKNFAAIKILIGKNSWNAAVNLCLKTLKHSRKYEFTELNRDICEFLRYYYGGQVGDVKQYKHYNDLFKKYSQTCADENLAVELYLEVIIHFINTKAKKEEVTKVLQASIDRLEQLSQETQTYKLRLCRMMLLFIQHSKQNDNQSLLAVVEREIDFFRHKDYVARTPLYAAYYQKMVSHAEFGQYELAKVAASHCTEFIRPGNFNWFKFNEEYFKLFMYCQDYQGGYRLFLQVIEDKSLEYQADSVIEIWKIIHAYLSLLIDLEYVVPTKKVRNFRVGKFLNDTPIFSKDKKGINISILIIQILTLIQQKRYSQTIDKIEAIEKYCYRHLYNDHTIRSFHFIKMLLCIPSASFHKAAVIRKAQPHQKRLKQVSTRRKNTSYYVEIVPYEALWDMIISTLDNTFSKVRK